MQVTWTEGAVIATNPSVKAYRVYLDDGSGNDPQLVYDTGLKSLTNLVSIAGLNIGHTYTLSVKSVNVIGESEASNLLTVFAGIAPTQIKSLMWESSSTTSVTVKWALPESNGGLPLTKFTLYIDVGRTGTFVPLDIVDTFTRTYLLSGQ